MPIMFWTSCLYRDLPPLIILSLASPISTLSCRPAHKQAWHLQPPEPSLLPLPSYSFQLPPYSFSLLRETSWSSSHSLQWLLTFETCCLGLIEISFTRLSTDILLNKLKVFPLSAFRIVNLSGGEMRNAMLTSPFLLGCFTFFGF